MDSSSPGPHRRGPGSFSGFKRAFTVLALVMLLQMLASCSEQQPREQITRRAVSGVSASPFDGCVSDRPISELLNENSEVEPTLAVDPSDPDRIAVAWQQDRWVDGASRGIVVATTSNGGEDWTTTAQTLLTPCSGAPGALPRVTDPWLSWGPNGTLHLSALRVRLDADAVVGADPEEVVASRSNDGGRTWSEPIVLIRDKNGDVYNDKPSITADPEDPARVYAVWHRLTYKGERVQGETLMARSINVGSTWEEPQVILGPLQDAQSFGNEIVAVPSSGEVKLFDVFTSVSFRGGREETKVEILSSSDNGLTWSEPVTIARFSAVPVRDPRTRAELKTGRLLPHIAVNPGSGILYAAWSDDRFGGSRFNDVALSMSTDEGRSWSPPVRANQTPVSADPLTAQSFIPEIAVAEDGSVSVAYYDFRNHDASARRRDALSTDLFVVTCAAPSETESDGCAGDWVERRLTQRSFDLGIAPRSPAPFLGDYIGLAPTRDGLFIAYPIAGSEGDPSSIFVEPIGRGDAATP